MNHARIFIKQSQKIKVLRLSCPINFGEHKFNTDHLVQKSIKSIEQLLTKHDKSI